MASRKANTSVARQNVSVSEHDDILAEAQEHVMYAAQLLRSAGGDCEKLAWMLEDALVYFDAGEQCSEEDLSRLQILG